VWDQEEDIDALTPTGFKELVSVMGARAIQQEQGLHLCQICARRSATAGKNISFAHSSNKRVVIKAFACEAGDTFELSYP
jgi:hypothetical protein